MCQRSALVTTMPASAALMFLLTVGCVATAPRTVNFAALGPPYRLEESGQRVTSKQHQIIAGSKDEQIIKLWLQAHESGWRVDLNTYAPGLWIKGDRFDMNISGRICVLNYDPSGKGNWVQVSRKIDENDPLPELFTRDH